MTLLTDLDAFYLEHRRCGNLRAGIKERERGAVLWVECKCGAKIVRPISAEEGQTA